MAKTKKQDQLINVFGCFKCGQLAGDLRLKHVTKTVQGYEQCPLCNSDLDYFWLNLTAMKFQASRLFTKAIISQNTGHLFGKDFGRFV